jgi:hypothetical protein
VGSENKLREELEERRRRRRRRRGKEAKENKADKGDTGTKSLAACIVLVSFLHSFSEVHGIIT